MKQEIRDADISTITKVNDSEKLCQISKIKEDFKVQLSKNVDILFSFFLNQFNLHPVVDKCENPSNEIIASSEIQMPPGKISNSN